MDVGYQNARGLIDASMQFVGLSTSNKAQNHCFRGHDIFRGHYKHINDRPYWLMFAFIYGFIIVNVFGSYSVCNIIQKLLIYA